MVDGDGPVICLQNIVFHVWPKLPHSACSAVSAIAELLFKFFVHQYAYRLGLNELIHVELLIVLRNVTVNLTKITI